MRQTGTLLRNARESKGVGLNEIALATKISPRILKAIESGDLDQLPPKTFLRGFVQSYAQYLNMDVDSVLEAFQEEMGTTRPTPQTIDGLEPAEAPSVETKERKRAPLAGLKSESQAQVFKITGIVLVVGVLLGGIMTLKRKMDSYQREQVVTDLPEVVALPPPDQGESENSAAEPSTPPVAEDIKPREPTPPQEPSAPPAVVQEPPASPPTSPPATVTTQSRNQTPEQQSVPPSRPTPEAPAPPRPTQAEETAAPATPPAPPTPPPTTVATERELVIEALGPVDVEWSINGQTQRVTMMPDEVRTIRYRTGVKLKVSDGGAVNLSRNGRDLGVPGSLGQGFEGNY